MKIFSPFSFTHDRACRNEFLSSHFPSSTRQKCGTNLPLLSPSIARTHAYPCFPAIPDDVKRNHAPFHPSEKLDLTQIE